MNKADIIDEIENHFERNEAPTSTTFNNDSNVCSLSSVYRLFDSWREAVDQADIHWRQKERFTNHDLKEAIQEYLSKNDTIDYVELKEDNYYPSVDTFKKDFDNFGKFLNFACPEAPNGYEKCSECGGYYQSIALHWNQSDCSYPTFTEKEKDILKGILMGDGSLNERDGKNTAFVVSLTNKKYLKWLSDKFGDRTSDVYLKQPERILERNGERYECSKYYSLTFKPNPLFDEWAEEWYDSQGKIFPIDNINPTISKHWFVTDGGLRWQRNNLNGVYIASYNDNIAKDYLLSLFDNFKYKPSIVDGGKIFFSAVPGREFLSWMGDSCPGFEYKWEVHSRQKYNNLKD